MEMYEGNFSTNAKLDLIECIIVVEHVMDSSCLARLQKFPLRKVIAISTVAIFY